MASQPNLKKWRIPRYQHNLKKLRIPRYQPNLKQARRLLRMMPVHMPMTLVLLVIIVPKLLAQWLTAPPNLNFLRAHVSSYSAGHLGHNVAVVA